MKISKLNKTGIFVAFLLVIVGVSCSKYEKLLKSTDVNLKYQKAFEYYNKENYSRAATLFEQIVTYYRGTAKGDSVMLYYAKSYYGQSDYTMAAYYFKSFTEIYGRSPLAEEAYYLEAYCHYKLSPRTTLDQEDTYLSIQKFKEFIQLYPESSYIPQSKGHLAELEDKLVEKSYINAKLYFDLGYYKASTIALRNSINEYPETKYREEMMFLILKSNFLLAEKSVPEKRRDRFQETVDEYYAFVSEFPESKFKKEAEKIFSSSRTVIGEISNDK